MKFEVRNRPLLSQQKFKYFRSLTLKKIREREGLFLIEGIKFCQEAITADVNLIAFLFFPQIISSKTVDDFIKLCENKNISYYEISHNMLAALSDTVHSQGVICVIEKSAQQLKLQNAASIVAIDAARDPGNVGTIIRTADWFGMDAVLLGEGTVELYNPKVLRSTMGSIFHLPVLSNINLYDQLYQLKKNGYTIYTADVYGDLFYNKVQFSERKVLVVGNETQGVSAKIASLSDAKIKIPSKGKAESLNLSVATGILLNQMVNNNGT